LYFGEHNIGDVLYSVEIITSTRNDLLISAYKVEGQESFIIEIQANKVEGLLAEFGGDLAYLANHLKLI
jgi:hypothetical protein